MPLTYTDAANQSSIHPIERLGRSINNYRVGLDLNEPVRIDKRCDLHDCVNRSDISKKFGMDSSNSFPVLNPL